MARSIREVENMSMDEIIKEYDGIASHTVDSLSTWEVIYQSRKQDETNNQLKLINIQMLKYTKWMTLLTVVVLLATIVNLLLLIF